MVLYGLKYDILKYMKFNFETVPVPSVDTRALEISKTLDESEANFRIELINFNSNDKDLKAKAREKLEEMKIDILNRLDMLIVGKDDNNEENLGLGTPEEADVRSRLTARLGELFELLEN